MRKLVECVPNISEGKDQGVIDSVTGVVEEVDGVRLLDVDPGADTNRTVMPIPATGPRTSAPSYPSPA
jgi:glutamate formiminotransferase/formiminotetrahydrofolate cyclodeaminase